MVDDRLIDPATQGRQWPLWAHQNPSPIDPDRQPDQAPPIEPEKPEPIKPPNPEPYPEPGPEIPPTTPPLEPPSKPDPEIPPVFPPPVPPVPGSPVMMNETKQGFRASGTESIGAVVVFGK